MTPTAAAKTGGRDSGRLQMLARSTRTRPRCVTVSPASRRPMTSAHSSSLMSRSSLQGQRSPVMCSLRFSPLPSATHNRSGNISASVAIACAVTAGW